MKEQEYLEKEDISKQCKRWVEQWLKWCEDKEIKPWLFDFKTFYLKEEDLKDESDPFLVWLQYKHDFLNKVQPNECVNNINSGTPDLGKEEDPDKLVFPIYDVLGWQKDQKDGIRGDSMNSFQTTLTELFKTNDDINDDSFRGKKKDCWYNMISKIPNVSDFFKNIAKNNDISIVYDNFEGLIDFFDEIKMFSALTHSVGNFIVLPSWVNTGRGSYLSNVKDYWDLTLKDIRDLFMLLKNGNELWKEYIDTFYLQPYVYKDTYKVAELWDGHFNKSVLPSEKSDFQQFYHNVNLLICERGKYMVKELCDKVHYSAPSEWNLDNISLDFFDEIQHKKNYCYIDDVLKARGKGFFTEIKYCYEKDNLDPDCYSKKLYKDLAKVCSGTINGHSFQFDDDNLELKLIVDGDRNKCYRFSSDFINPCSKLIKEEYEFSDEILAKWFHQGRVLGGHAVFCRHENSINQKKSGKPTFDRFDICLDEIKDFYLNDCDGKNSNIVGKHKDSLRKAINKDKEFFTLFGDGEEGFKNYVNFFKLTDFVDNNFNVISLAWSDIVENRIFSIDTEYNDINKYKGTNFEKYYTYLPGRNLYVKKVEEDKDKKEPTPEEEKDYAIKYVNNVLSLIKRRNDKMYLDLIK